MRNITDLSSRFGLASNTIPSRTDRYQEMTASERTEIVLEQHSSTLDAIRSILAHPRALTRESAQWRPPSKKLPAVAGMPPLVITLQRTRLGTQARDMIARFGEQRPAAFLLTARFASPTGAKVRSEWAHAWMRALLLDDDSFDMHELLAESTPTICWVSDRHLRPVRSPGALFDTASAA